jgi:hypothetical protein
VLRWLAQEVRSAIRRVLATESDPHGAPVERLGRIESAQWVGDVWSGTARRGVWIATVTAVVALITVTAYVISDAATGSEPVHPSAAAADLSLAAPQAQAPAAEPETARYGPGPLVEPLDSPLPRISVPIDITGDCSSDVTERLNAWLAAVPDGSVIEFPRGACYRVDGSLLLSGRQHLVIEGNESTFRAVDLVPYEVNRAQWFLDYGADLVLRNMTLSGPNPRAVLGQDTAFDHNVFVRGTHGVVIEHVRGGNTYGDFVAVAHGRDGRTIPSDVTVAHSWAENVGRMGVSCVACDGLTVRDNLFRHIALSVITIEVEGDGWPARRIRIESNEVGSHGWSFVALGAPFQTVDNDISDIAVVGNTMTEASSGHCQSAIDWSATRTTQSNVRIEGNVLRAGNDAVAITTSRGVTVAGNQLFHEGNCDAPTPVGVRLVASSDVHVRGNEVTGFAARVLQQ